MSYTEEENRVIEHLRHKFSELPHELVAVTSRRPGGTVHHTALGAFIDLGRMERLRLVAWLRMAAERLEDGMKRGLDQTALVDRILRTASGFSILSENSEDKRFLQAVIELGERAPPLPVFVETLRGIVW